MSWNQVSATVKQVSNALLNLGVKPQENIGIFSQNSVQYIECDFGAWGIRAVTIPFYATSSEQQIQFMVNDAKVRFLFMGYSCCHDTILCYFVGTADPVHGERCQGALPLCR